MRVEKHNAHGMQLIMVITPAEARLLIEQLSKAYGLTFTSEEGYYIENKCLFEDDNDKWEEAKFDVVVTRDYASWNLGLVKCSPAYPKGVGA